MIDYIQTGDHHLRASHIR